MHGWQANKSHTCVLPEVLGLCPKRKNHPLCGWMIIFLVHRNSLQTSKKTQLSLMPLTIVSTIVKIKLQIVIWVAGIM